MFKGGGWNIAFNIWQKELEIEDISAAKIESQFNSRDG